MAARGRPPKPHHLKLVDGNPGRRPLTPPPVAAKAEQPKPPAHFKGDLLKVWKRVLGCICDDYFKLADENNLAAFCEAVHYRNKAAAELVDAPLIVTGGNGNPTPNPLLKIVESQTRLIHQLGSTLGLDPVARQRIIATPDAKQDGDVDNDIPKT